MESTNRKLKKKVYVSSYLVLIEINILFWKSNFELNVIKLFYYIIPADIFMAKFNPNVWTIQYRIATSYIVFRLINRCMRIHLKGSSVFLFLYAIILPEKAFIFLSSTKAVIGMLCKEVSMCKRVAITKNSFTCSFPSAPPPPQQGH